MPVLTAQERLGTTLAEKYRLDRIIGEGGWGVVFAGVHTWIQRDVAVKLLHPEHARKPEVVHRFLQEAKAAARLKHPNVVDVLDMGRDADGSVYLVLEFLRGETLRDRLDRERQLSLPEALAAIVPILGALAEAHDHRIVHRDLKPDNIYLATERERVTPKVLDFGIAKIMDGSSATATGTIMGTPSYMAPEQVQGSPNVSPAADVWSMGVVLYECLTGRVPFGGDSVAVVLVNILTAPLVPVRALRPDVDEPLAQVIERALARPLDVRHRDARALLDDLRSVIGGLAEQPLAPAAPAPPAASGERTGDLVASAPVRHTPPEPSSGVTNDSAGPPTRGPRTQALGSPTPGPNTPGPNTPGPNTPGPYPPGPYTPGPYTPGPYTPGPYTPSAHAPDAHTPAPVPGASTGTLVVGAGAASTPVGWDGQAARPAPRSRALLVAAAGAVGLLGLAGVGIAIATGGTDPEAAARSVREAPPTPEPPAPPSLEPPAPPAAPAALPPPSLTGIPVVPSDLEPPPRELPPEVAPEEPTHAEPERREPRLDRPRRVAPPPPAALPLPPAPLRPAPLRPASPQPHRGANDAPIIE